VIVAEVLTGACGGGNDEDAVRGSSAVASADTTLAPAQATSPVDAGSSGEAGGAIDGPLVLVSGAGLWTVDPNTGEGRPLTFDGVEGVAVGTDPALGEGAAYVFTYDTVDGQSFSQTVHVGAVDLATGATRTVVTVGTTRTADTDQNLVEFDALAATGSTVWVRTGAFGERERELIAYESSTGAEVRRVAVDAAEHLTSDGTALYFYADGNLVRLDPATGTDASLIEQFPSFTDIADPAQLADLAVTRSGAPVPADEQAATADFLGLRLGPLVAGGGSLWVLASGSASTTGGDLVVADVVLQLDPATGSVQGVVPLTGFGDTFTGENEISIGDESLVWVGDSLWVADRQTNGAVLRVASGGATLAFTPCTPDVRCDNARFDHTDPDGLWLHYTRLAPTGDGSSSGPLVLDQLDPGTGSLIRSTTISELIGS
jgi:hypothetical protein